MVELLSFLILISAGLFLSEIFRRLHVPYVVGLIIAGILIGPYVFNILTIDPIIEFLGSIGLIFLMFMAGLEIRLSSFEKLRNGIAGLTLLNALIPFTAGFLIALYFGYGLLSAFLLGIIFISSSIAIVIPSLERHGLLKSRVGQSIVASTILEDVLSLVLLSIVLQSINPTTAIPLPIFYLLLFSALIGLKYILPKIREYLFPRSWKEKYLFEQDLRFIFVILIAIVVFFEILGVHPIIAGFFTGFALSESIKSEKLKEKLHAISYGLFIPAFFIIIGAQTDIGVFLTVGSAAVITAVVLTASIGSKFISGWIGGRLMGFNSTESALVGASTIPQLSTTLAVAFVGLEFNLLDQQLITAMIALSIVTTFVGPLLVAMIANKLKEKIPVLKK